MNIFITILSLLNISSAVIIFWDFSSVSLPIHPVNIMSLLLANVYLILSYGYLKRKAWAWYGTFFQIAMSILLAATNLTFLFALIKLPEETANILSTSFLALEIVKGAVFFHPAFKRYFHLNTTQSKIKRKYRVCLLISLLFLVLINVAYFLITFYGF